MPLIFEPPTPEMVLSSALWPRSAGFQSVFNLLYRRIAFGKAPPVRNAQGCPTPCGLKIRDTAECNSALRGRDCLRELQRRS